MKNTLSNSQNEDCQGKKTKTRDIIMDMMRKDPKITMQQLASEIGVTPKAIEKQIMRLRSIGAIEREGSNRSGLWKVNGVQPKKYVITRDLSR